MTIQLKMNTNVRRGIEFILAGEVDPIIDANNIRYLISIHNWELGMIHWTPFDLTTQEVIGTHSFSKPFAAHNTFRDMLTNASPMEYPEGLLTTEFPTFSLPMLDNGSVSP